jgi:hypothetical protein
MTKILYRLNLSSNDTIDVDETPEEVGVILEGVKHSKFVKFTLDGATRWFNADAVIYADLGKLEEGTQVLEPADVDTEPSQIPTASQTASSPVVDK